MSYNKYEYILKPLPYEYNGLEPSIDARTIEIHHNRHLKSYVDNLNRALKGYPALQQLELPDLIKRSVLLPLDARTPILNNGGGVYNHNMYFDGMRAPRKDNKPIGRLGDAIDKEFGGFDSFKKEFSEQASKVFGSGWTWLVAEPKKRRRLKILSTANQNTPLHAGYHPIMLIDVWEHAYYLKYQNKRADYISAWWDAVNWDKADELYRE